MLPGAGVEDGLGAEGRSGTADVLAGALEAEAGAGGGRDSFCHASHRSTAENENTTNRIRRWVSMTTWVSARPLAGVLQKGLASRDRVVSARMIGMTTQDAAHGEHGPLERTVL